MPTTKTRINVSLPDEIRDALAKLAQREQVPPATKAAHLIRLALEIEEDIVWDARATKRDRKGAKFVSHKQAWV